MAGDGSGQQSGEDLVGQHPPSRRQCQPVIDRLDQPSLERPGQPWTEDGVVGSSSIEAVGEAQAQERGLRPCRLDVDGLGAARWQAWCAAIPRHECGEVAVQSRRVPATSQGAIEGVRAGTHGLDRFAPPVAKVVPASMSRAGVRFESS